VTIKNTDMIELALSLHDKAHDNCFIANSVNFPVKQEPIIITEE
jgi:organic hydroperoxide reductase OsmC/OhrA